MFFIEKSEKQNILSDKLFSRIEADLSRGEQVVLVVPAQASIAMEKAAFEKLKKDGFFKLHIIRGQKLHEEILKDSGYPPQTAVNSIGRSMLLRKIACDNKDKLKAFASLGESSGFIDMAGDFIVQLKQNNLKPEDLEEICREREGSLLSDKLSDMILIAKEYENVLSSRFTDSENMLAYVSEAVKNSSFVKNSKIYYYGFYSFTRREIQFLSELECYSKALGIYLLGGDENIFALTEKTEEKLLESIKGSSSFESCGGYSIPAKEKRVIKCANPYAQALTMASDIRRLVRSRGLKYSEIAVLCGASEELSSVIKRVFAMFSIPVFADEKRSVLHSSALEALSALLDMVRADFRTADIIRFVKSGVLGFTEDSCELFENYSKQFHIKGRKLFEAIRYGKSQYSLEEFSEIENVRAKTADAAKHFSDRFSSAETVKEKSECLYLFLSDELRLPDYLENLSAIQADEGFLDASEESSQLWNCIVSVLEQMVELIGERIMDCDAFTDMLMSAFSDLKVGVLPQAEGKLQLGTIARSHLEGIKALYIAGFNEGIIPSDADAGGILTEDELGILRSRGMQIAKDSDTIAQEEEYNLFACMACPSDYLCLTYSVSSADGSALKASPLLSDITGSYGPFTENMDIESSFDELAFMEGESMLRMHLGSALRSAMSGEEISETGKYAFNLIKDRLDVSKEGLRYSGKRNALGKDTARLLFEKNGELSFSPSRMDGFAACPFKHFVNYGLNPQEQREYTMDGGQIGSLYHEILMRLCRDIKDWTTVTDDEIERRVDLYLEEISKGEAGELINSAPSEKYTSSRVRNVCIRFARFMAMQLKQESIERMFVETAFGRGKLFPAIEIITSAGKVYVEGKIDRIDVCPDGDGKYIRIVDYKSGNTSFRKDLIEKGLSLQLMTYLEGAMGSYPQESKTGVYYFSIKDPQIAANLQDLPLDALSDQLLAKIKKEYRLDGQDVDKDFREHFINTLSGLCERLAMGEINPEPKKVKTYYDSCQYCQFSGICGKDIC